MNNMKLRICVTDKCNFNCTYCGSGGEGKLSDGYSLSYEERISIISKLHEIGIDSYRITGGEPLLYPELYKLLDDLQNHESLNKITIVTNGSLINDKFVNYIKKSKIKSVTISLDALDKETFRKVTRIDSYEKVINNIIRLKQERINVKINSVATKQNEKEIYKLIGFAISYGINLKILDLFETDKNHWKEEYLNLIDIEQYLNTISKKKFVQYQDEGFGIPENVFVFEHSNVVTKNSDYGTCYCEYCKECKKYPCKTGVVSFVLTADGYLKLCSEIQLDVKELLNNTTSKQIELDIKKIFEFYNASKRIKI